MASDIGELDLSEPGCERPLTGIQAATPHHRQRNNNEPARNSRSVGVFAPKPAPPGDKIDRRRLCTPKLKRGPRLSNEELIARGLGEYTR